MPACASVSVCARARLQLGDIPLLSKDEEFDLGKAAQRWLPIDRLRKDFEQEFARPPTAEVRPAVPLD